MNNLVKTRNWIIIILCSTIVCMGIGFAIVTMQLENVTNEHPTFAVEFTSAKERTPVQGGIKTPSATSSITNSNQTINIEFNLSSPRDEISYRITIKNTGNVKAEIIELIEKPDYLTSPAAATSILPVKISHNSISGKVLDPGEEVDLTIIAMYDYNATSSPVTVPYQLSILAKSKE